MYVKWLIQFLISVFVVMGFFQIIYLIDKDIMLNPTERLIYFKRDWIREGSFKEEKNKESIVVLGDSSLAAAFAPNVFDSLSSSTNTLNLSIVSHDTLRHYFILKDFIKYNYTPDYIIWEPTSKKGISHFWNANKEETWYYYNISKKPILLIDYYIPSLNPQKVKQSFMSLFIDKQSFELSKENLIKDNGVYYIGNSRTKKLAVDFTCDLYDETIYPKLPQLDDNSMSDIYLFLDFTKKHNIKVLIVTPPAAIGANKLFNEKPEFYKLLETKYDNIKVADSWNSNYYSTELFFNATHLNYFGAEVYTKKIFNDFKTHYLDKKSNNNAF